MFQIICQIGPLNILTYGMIVAIIAAIGCLVLVIMKSLGGDRRKAISAVIFWTLVLTVLMMIPLFPALPGCIAAPNTNDGGACDRRQRLFPARHGRDRIARKRVCRSLG